MMKMEPMYYAKDEVYYNVAEFHNPDMIEGNNQLKALEPGYTTPDDAPDADEGAWHYIDKHIPDENPAPKIGKRERKTGW